nr:hypothetical protein [uncultured Campylobacter sp.]
MRFDLRRQNFIKFHPLVLSGVEFQNFIRAHGRRNFKILSMRSGSGILKFHLNYRRRVIGGRAARKQRLHKSEILKFTRRGKIKFSVYLAIYANG